MENIINKINQTEKLGKLIDVPDGLLEENRLLNLSPFIDSRIYLNVEKIIRSGIVEFKDSSEKIDSFIFGNSLSIFEKIVEFGIESKHVKEAVRKWVTKEGKDAFGFFGSAKYTKPGKSLGDKKKIAFAKAVGEFLKEIYDAIYENNFKRARLINFIPSTVDGVDIDNISDLILHALEDSFANFTDKKIEELKIKEEFTTDFKGKKVLNLYNPETNKYKREFFYPEEFFSDMPLVDERDFNLMRSTFQEHEAATTALADIFSKKSIKLAEKLEEASVNKLSEEYIYKLLDFKYFLSTFKSEDGFNYKQDGQLMKESFEKISKQKTIDSVMYIDMTIDEISDSLTKKFGKSFSDFNSLNEKFIQELFVALLSVKFSSNVISNAKTGLDDEYDIEINDSDAKFLIELKLIKNINKLSSLKNNFVNQQLTYYNDKKFDGGMFIVIAVGLEREDLKKLTENLEQESSKLSSKINNGWKVISFNRKIVSASKSSKFEHYSKVIRSTEEVEKVEIISSEYASEALKLKSEYRDLSGRTINHVVVEKIKEAIDVVKRDRQNYIDKILKITNNEAREELELKNLIYLENLYNGYLENAKKQSEIIEK